MSGGREGIRGERENSSIDGNEIASLLFMFVAMSKVHENI